MNSIKKVMLELFILFTFVGCSSDSSIDKYTTKMLKQENKVSYIAKNESGEDLEIKIITGAMFDKNKSYNKEHYDLAKNEFDLKCPTDSAIQIHNLSLKRTMTYINLVYEYSPNLVDRIVKKDHNLIFNCGMFYERAEYLEQEFCDADKDYRAKANFVIAERKKALSAEIKNINDLVNK
jgi:hypothetical protein